MVVEGGGGSWMAWVGCLRIVREGGGLRLDSSSGRCSCLGQALAQMHGYQTVCENA